MSDLAQRAPSTSGAGGGVRPAPWATLIALAALGAALSFFAVQEQQLQRLDGLWIDEIFSLWQSDSSRDLLWTLRHRILPDANPPLFPFLLYLVRLSGLEPIQSFMALNCLAIGVGCVASIWVSARIGELVGGVLSCALFLLSASVLTYGIEGRTYALALSLSLATSWLVISAVAKPAATHVFGLAAAGLLAACTHVYSGLFACSLASGVAVVATLRRSLPLWRSALALGFAAGAPLLAFVVQEHLRVRGQGWISFNARNVIDSLWFVERMIFGKPLVFTPFAIVLGVSLVQRRSDVPLVFLVAWTLFAVIPLAASLLQPIVVGRYWMICAPSVIVVLTWIVGHEWRGGRSHWIVAAIGAAALLGPLVFSTRTARDFTTSKSVWAAAEARHWAQGCPSASVRVETRGGRPPIFYAIASGLPTRLFTPGDRSIAAPMHLDCPLVGWAEHVLEPGAYLANATDLQLLARLGLSSADGLRVIRHSSGFLVVQSMRSAAPVTRRAAALGGDLVF